MYKKPMHHFLRIVNSFLDLVSFFFLIKGGVRLLTMTTVVLWCLTLYWRGHTKLFQYYEYIKWIQHLYYFKIFIKQGSIFSFMCILYYLANKIKEQMYKDLVGAIKNSHYNEWYAIMLYIKNSRIDSYYLCYNSQWIKLTVLLVNFREIWQSRVKNEWIAQ